MKYIVIVLTLEIVEVLVFYAFLIEEKYQEV